MEKILIIDDDKDLCFVLKRFLSKHGFEVIEATSGKAALEILEGLEPDLILCDFRLEDMSGSSILKKDQREESLRSRYHYHGLQQHQDCR